MKGSQKYSPVYDSVRPRDHYYLKLLTHSVGIQYVVVSESWSVKFHGILNTNTSVVNGAFAQISQCRNTAVSLPGGKCPFLGWNFTHFEELFKAAW